MRELRELRLPKLIEAREGRFVTSAPDAQSASPMTLSQSSASLDQTPISPTFSLRSLGKCPSANSSLASSPTMRSSLDDYSPKRPLTDVREEPVHEKEDEFEMVDAFPRDCEGTKVEHLEEVSIAEYLEKNRSSAADYDWVDTPPFEATDFDFGVSKRHCANEPSSPNAIQSRLSARFPSLTRKWKNIKDQRSSSIPDSVYDSTKSRSRASSMKSPSILDVKSDPLDRPDVPMPPTPSQSCTLEGSLHEEPDLAESTESLRDHEEDARPQSLTRTPLLPPVLALMTNDQPIQSPLQSPTIADSTSLPQSPFESTSPYSGLPSPPLSTKPSITSFHRRPIIPSSEIPSIRLAEPQDEWSSKLGHFNFTIEPQPYTPATPMTIAACKCLRADWDAASQHYVQHLARAAEIHGTTSTVYRHTQDKWATINDTWKRNYEHSLTLVPRVSQEPPQASQHQEPLPVAASLAKLPSLNGPQSDGKFPKAGENGFVGPMPQGPPVASPRPSRKRVFWKFLQGVLPSSVAFGRSQA